MKIYHVDAFSDVVFKGNPAAICPLDNSWLPDETMLNIAAENNLSETAFYIQNTSEYEIRWFTPKGEVDLCGHATLAAAHVIFTQEHYQAEDIVFNSRSGKLTISKKCNHYTLDFPEDTINKIKLSEELLKCFNYVPIEAYKGKTDYMLIFNEENMIRSIIANIDEINRLDARGIIVTAPGTNVDFVSRFFAPRCGVNEDPVTGSAHTSLVPYWSKILNKSKLTAIQLSERQGNLLCEKHGNRIKISGNAKTYLIGNIFI